ncbi:MAG TPA: ATP-binding protein [Gammaproteobacteria bacterium]
MGDKHKPTKPQARRSAAAKRAPVRLGTAKRLDTDAHRQLHALQVHQVELEMQNAELRKVRAELHASLTRYTALYEFAPVAYLTLTSTGAILELNQTAAGLLGGRETELRHQRLGSRVAAGSGAAFATFLAGVFQGNVAQDYEFELQRPDGSRFWAQVSAVHQDVNLTCLVAMIDITGRRDALHRTQDAERLAQTLLRQNRDLTRRMFALLEEDRRNILREMHDELGASFRAINAETSVMIMAEQHLQPRTRAGIRAINAITAEMQNALRRILLRLRPTMLDSVGLAESLRELVLQWGERHRGIACEIALEGELSGLGEMLDIALFRVVQEALTNVAKHGRAKRLSVQLVRREAEVHLVIEDDGRGFDPAIAGPGMGMLGMRERVIALKGSFEFRSQPGHGVHIDAHIPAPAAPDPQSATAPH